MAKQAAEFKQNHGLFLQKARQKTQKMVKDKEDASSIPDPDNAPTTTTTTVSSSLLKRKAPEGDRVGDEGEGAAKKK